MERTWHACTQGELLTRLARDLGDRLALAQFPDGPRWSFAELDARVDRLARGLIASGLEPGDHVTLWSDNRPDWIPLLFALARIGAVLVTANTALQEEEIRYLLEQSRSRALLLMPGMQGEDSVASIRALRDQGALAEVDRFVVLDEVERPDFDRLEDLLDRAAMVDEAELRRRSEAVTPDLPANIQYTSGTTGFPKGVVLTHANLVENGWSVGECLRITPEDRQLLQVPLFHCFGCSASLLGCFTHGASLVALQRFDPEAALRAIASERCTLVHGVPTMFQAILAHPDYGRTDLSSLRAGIMGGSMCPEPLMRRVIEDMGCSGMLVGYGLTEASPGVTFSSPDDPIALRCGTVGRVMPGVELQIVSTESGDPVPNGTQGELWCRGPNVMQGYFDRPEETAQAITPEGWLRTGDLATLDDDGVVRIVGRIKEMIIRGGENVSPAEVEDALRTLPGVADAAVFGLPDEHWGEVVAAAVVAEPGHPLDRSTLLADLEGKLAPFKRPVHLEIVDAFPLTPSGKVKKFELAERCALSRPSPTPGSPPAAPRA